MGDVISPCRRDDDPRAAPGRRPRSGTLDDIESWCDGLSFYCGGMLSRRSLLTASLGAVAVCAGCGTARTSESATTSTSTATTPIPASPTARPTHAASATASATGTPSASTASASASGTPSAEASASGTMTPTLTHDQVLARFGSQRPREWGLHSTGTVNRGSASAVRQGLVALTFDACGGVGGWGHDADLIALLRRLQVPATLTLNARWIHENESLAHDLGSDPLFEIQSHGNRHLPLSVEGRRAYGIAGTESVGAAYDELISGTATIQGVARHNTVRFMRPGTAYSDDVAAGIGLAIGMPVLDFSINGDFGATASASQIVRNLEPVTGGDIVISHMNHPEHDTAEGYARALPILLRRGVRFAHISQVV